MSVLIVESPAKCKTISKYVGNDFKVLASYGHVRSLPSKKGSVLPNEDFHMVYEVHGESKKYIANLIKAVKETDFIYLATDPDREGEAISWHVVEILRAKRAIKKGTRVHRIAFNEITKPAVLAAIQNPREIDMNLVQAQQTRQALDYLFGFTLSPLLWKKLPGSRSAGRVQSVALRIICERENGIKSFVSDEYWKIAALFEGKKSFQAFLVQVESKKLEKLSIKSEEEAEGIVDNLVGKKYKVIKIEKKEVRKQPYSPFITSTLQQDAANKLGFSTKKTMMIAQKLYEGVKIGEEELGLITYMRTDGVYVSDAFIKSTRKMILEHFGIEYIPKVARKYTSKIKNAQEAHEAIRPTNINLSPESVVKYLEEDHLKLYKLIWKRMVASQMEAVVFEQVVVTLEAEDKYALFRVAGSTIKFDGFYKVYKNKPEGQKIPLLPDLKEGEVYKPKGVVPSQHFTQPPPRFTEASLVKKMEELGIGRPSTYATIISVLQDRKYVVLDEKKFIPEMRGQFVTAFLSIFFKRYVEYDFTAKLEEELDKISNYEARWKEVLRNFWEKFFGNVKEVEKYEIAEILLQIDKVLELYTFVKGDDGKVDRSCPKCDNGRLNLNIGRFGAFLGCSAYPECDYRRSMSSDSVEISGNMPELIGVNPLTQEEIILKEGPYGLYLQCGDKKGTLPKGMDVKNIDLCIAVKLLSMPYSIGVNSENGLEVKVGVGRYGPYILHDKKFTSINLKQLFNISLEDALLLINNKKNKSQILGQYNDKDVELCNGRYGPYLKYDGKNIALPKGLKNKSEITYKDALSIVKVKL